MSDVTQILVEMQRGDAQAAQRLLPVVYDQLRKLAAARMSAERADHTLQATALVHEAYLRLVTPDPSLHWDSRAHFFSAASEAMRRILVEAARRRKRLKRGGEARRLALPEEGLIDAKAGHSFDERLLDLDSALSRFCAHDPVKAELVKLRYFGGLTIHDAAQVLGVSTATADRYWAYSRAWLQRELRAASEK